MADQGQIQRGALPIADRGFAGLVTYDARDPEAHFNLAMTRQ